MDISSYSQNDMKRLFVFSLLMLAVVTATAQSVLTGTIKNSQGTRVEFVSIGVEGDSIGTVSDVNGYYLLTISVEQREH